MIPRDGFGSPDWDSTKLGETLTKKAIEFIDRHHRENQRTGKQRPFFMHFCSPACHVPHTPPKTLLGEPVRGKTGLGHHADMIYELDVTLGKLMGTLEKRGLLKDTLIIYTSDNGGLTMSQDKGHNSNAPLRGHKGGIYEGGHRVPFVARWGDRTAAGSKIAPGSRSDQLIGLHDLFGTLGELAGARLSQRHPVRRQSFRQTSRTRRE